MAALGHAVRMKRLMSQRYGRFLDITLDHGIARGVLPGLENIEATLSTLVQAAPDAITLQKGIASTFFNEFAGTVPLILKCTSYSPFHNSYDTHVATVEEALGLGADAISIGVIIGSEKQHAMLTQLARFVRTASAFGVPTIAHMYPRGSQIPDTEHYEEQHVKYAARVGAELGVDIIKTHYTGDTDSFARVVEATPAHVVAAGGTESGDPREFIQKAKDVVIAGGAGLACGRFVWSYPEPPRLIQALKAVIHDDVDVDNAIESLGST